MPPPPPRSKNDDKKGSKSGPRPDPFVGSRIVVALNTHNIEEYLADKDVTLVMFYDPKDAQCEWSKKHFLKAAKTTVRANSAYGAVDCTQQEDLCERETITSVPFFKLYSRGKVFGSYGKPKEFIYHTMKKYVENAPVMEEPKPPVCLPLVPQPCNTY